MSKYALMKELLEKVEEFEQAEGEFAGDMESFVSWLFFTISKKKPDTLPQLSTDFRSAKQISRKQTTEIEISTLIAHMYKYAKHYSKKVLDNTALSTIDDFGFMATLLSESNLTKSDLINRHLMEITSGTEVIKRLIKGGLIIEEPNPDDKRSKILKISPQGFGVMMQAFSEMNKVAYVISGNLSQMEKKVFTNLLNKLKDFHSNIHDTDRKAEIDDILSKYIISEYEPKKMMQHPHSMPHTMPHTSSHTHHFSEKI